MCRRPLQAPKQFGADLFSTFDRPAKANLSPEDNLKE